MAIIKAAASGNNNATATWDGGVIPGPGDDVYLNNKTVTIVEDWEIGTLRNAAEVTTGAVAGGTTYINGGVTLIAECFATNATLINKTSNGESTLIGNITPIGSSGLSMDAGGGVFNIVGAVYGGTTHNGSGIYGSAGIVYVTSVQPKNYYSGYAVAPTGSLQVFIGTAYGNEENTSSALRNSSVASQYCEEAYPPLVQAGSTLYNAGTGSIFVDKVYGGELISSGAYWTHTVRATASGKIYMKEVVWHTSGVIPFSDYCFLRNDEPSITSYDENGDPVVLVSALSLSPTWFPPANDVRSGISYANAGMVGTCKVPAPESVAFGVEVDDTVGTALLTNDQLLNSLGAMFAAYFP